MAWWAEKDEPDEEPEQPRPGTIQERFELFHAANPWVFTSLERLTIRARARGRTKIGMKMLVELLRWDYWMATDDPTSDFKLSNDYTSRYARLMLQVHPEWEGMFELRDLRAS